MRPACGRTNVLCCFVSTRLILIHERLESAKTRRPCRLASLRVLLFQVTRIVSHEYWIQILLKWRSPVICGWRAELGKELSAVGGKERQYSAVLTSLTVCDYDCGRLCAETNEKQHVDKFTWATSTNHHSMCKRGKQRAFNTHVFFKFQTHSSSRQRLNATATQEQHRPIKVAGIAKLLGLSAVVANATLVAHSCCPPLDLPGTPWPVSVCRGSSPSKRRKRYSSGQSRSSSERTSNTILGTTETNQTHLHRRHHHRCHHHHCHRRHHSLPVHRQPSLLRAPCASQQPRGRPVPVQRQRKPPSVIRSFSWLWRPSGRRNGLCAFERTHRRLAFLVPLAVRMTASPANCRIHRSSFQ